MSHQRILIIGAGLSGLSLAYFLKKNGIRTTILEARNRIGGRILTINGKHQTPMEMGATWFGKKHVHLLQLLEELDLQYFPQYNSGISFFETMSFAPPQKFEIPQSAEPYFRIKNGTSFLIEQLIKLIGRENIILNQPIQQIKKQNNYISVLSKENKTYNADILISTLPPKLFAEKIQTIPILPADTIHIFKSTQTWMEQSIKFSVEFSKPFWRQNGISGTVFSQSSIIPEMYDHCNFEENKFALKGFLSGAVLLLSKTDRERKVMETLQKFFGPLINDHLGYHEKIWQEENFTFSISTQPLFSHQNNGHQDFQHGYWENRLWFSGSETSINFGGYMEGAIQASKRTAEQILKKLK